ncbi:FG-GAP-like repeat-containing protein [Flavobacterium saccharophilum]|uniref:Repeat domain-containing protein n=1 Tax=Flavobacterium saccharophilum TaxID=29534 RepID=A0A1M7JIH9_9FLAO|nr:FG-GAP-like repeat-containing protein [Flavobacterium saccharophilum]SHM52862.1 Repeat domain-containing protein [Flavobacterium saccharophilum]
MKIKSVQLLQILLVLFVVISCGETKNLTKTLEVAPSNPITVDYKTTGNLTKKIILNITNPGDYAGLSVFADNVLLLDDFDIPIKGAQQVTGIVTFSKEGDTKIRFESLDQKLTINSYQFEGCSELQLPIFKDISVQAGLEKANSIKYGGPSVADIDNDGDYDFIVNNHNAEPSKLYWNNGDGTVTKDEEKLARWFKQDLHGTALGDYDNDGDLDLVLTQGGGNGKAPSTDIFYLNNNKDFMIYTGDVGIDKGGRGRGARWIDMDLDGDLDLLLFNESTLTFTKPQHFFYENKGDGTFAYKSVNGIQDIEESRVLVTDFNNDKIDDIIFYSPMSFWKGNGDFTFTEVNTIIPKEISSLSHIMAITDIDIDNDGDLDLYLAQGNLFEHGKGETPSLDFNPLTKELALKTRAYKDVDAFDFTADGTITIDKYYYLAQGAFLNKDYPIFLGKNKISKKLNSGEKLDISPEMAIGWPDDRSADGFYLGHLGNSKWKAALVRNGDIFWQYRFSLLGVSSVTPKFVPQNRNRPDILLRNDGTKFTDVSKEWNIPQGGNALGVTTGDFNNDGYQDLFIYRWGRVGARVSDNMLLNSGKNSFEATTMHGANDVGGPGNGDMGQAFDFDLDGKIDLLNGSEGGEWYLYKNNTPQQGNYALVRVGYSPKSHIDPISAEVIVTTATKQYRKRVGSAGEVFSQSLLNIIHFGLGKETEIKSIQIRWRNGETAEFKNKAANNKYDTDKLDPESITISPLKIRKGTSAKLSLEVTPKNAVNAVTWSSDNDKIATVDANGIVTALGTPNQTAVITATSKSNGITSQTTIAITEWTPLPVTSIKIEAKESTFYTGQKTALTAIVSPENADNARVNWTTENSKIATVDSNGIVNAIATGQTTIQASTADGAVVSKIPFEVVPFINPFIKITNKEQLKSQTLKVGDDFKVTVNYNAGSGNRVIAADEGGIRFWLRHFQSQWIPVKDVVLIDTDALKTESGSATKTFSLKGLIPTKDLPENHFYQLRVGFTSSDGKSYNDEILPLEIVAE